MTKKGVWWLLSGCLLLVAVTVAATLIVVSPVSVQPNAAPWWGIPIFTLAGGIGGALIAGFYVGRVEDKRIKEQRFVRKEDAARRDTARLLEITDQRVSSLFSGTWSLEQEREMFSALTVVTLSAPEAVRNGALEYIDALRTFEAANAKATTRQKEALYKDQVQAKHASLLVAVRKELGYDP